MVLSLVACSNNSANNEATEETSKTETSETTTEEGTEEETEEVDLREPELVTLDIVTMASGKEESGITEVEEAMNALLEEQFNVNVNLAFIPFGSYAEQITLMLSAGEGVDLLAVYMVNYASAATTGQLQPMDDYIETYGQGIIDALGWDMINCGRVDGELFGLTQGRDLAASQGFVYSIDMAEKHGVKLGFENVEGEEYLAALMEHFWDSPACGFCLDTGHELCYNGGKDMLSLYGDKLCHTHFNDNLGVYDPSLTWENDLHLVPGDGIVDFAGVMTRIEKTPYDGPILFELTLTNKPGRGDHDRYRAMGAEGFYRFAYERALAAVGHKN